jgi:Common central domain of tyrosinase
MAHRADLNTLTPAQRTQLVNLMLGYLTDAVVSEHASIIHSGLELFTGHRAYLLDMENYLSANGGGAFDPLPFWNSANPIPAEFSVVKNPGALRPPLGNLNPNIPKPPQFEYPAVCDYDDPAQLGNDINGWHGSVHCAIGGTMCMLPVASAAPIFWCWHGFVDHIYWDWQRCTVSCPDVTGCTLEIAKKKLKAAGLNSGSLTRIPRCVLPPDRCIPAYQDPDPSHYFHTEPQEPPHHDHHDHNHSQNPSQHEGQHGESHHGEGTEAPSHEFLHPKPDYSYLLRGPRVIAQAPGAYTTVKARSAVDLTLID